MNIIEKKINEIKPYEKNPRKNDEAVKFVKASIENFGFKVPIVIDKDNTIVCGHTRWKAAKELKMKTVPCIMADDLNEEQIKAFRLADNKTAEMAGWDFNLLEEELENIFNFDMTSFGFLEKTDHDIDSFFESVETETKKEEEEHFIICPDCGRTIYIDKNYKVIEK